MNRKLLLILFTVLATLVPAHADNVLRGTINGEANKRFTFSGRDLKNIEITQDSYFTIGLGTTPAGATEENYLIPNSGKQETYSMTKTNPKSFKLVPGIYDFYLDGSNWDQLRVTRQAPPYLFGRINGVDTESNPTGGIELVSDSKVKITTDSYFRVYYNGKQYGPYEADYTIPSSSFGTEQSYGMREENTFWFKLTPGIYTINYDKNLTVTVKKEATVNNPAENRFYFLYGDINGVIDWKDLITTYKLKSKTNGTFERNYVIIAKSKLRVSDGADWYAPDTDVEMASSMSDNGDGTWTYNATATKGGAGSYILEKGLYTFNFNPDTGMMTITELGGYPGQSSPHETQDYTWLYYNACAWGAYSLSESDPYIYCYLFTDNTPIANINSWNPSGGLKMTRIVEQVYGCKVPTSEIAKYKSVGFYFNSKKGFIKQPAQNGGSWDKDNWTKFIYGNGENCAVQTYVTFADFVAARRAEKTNLWICGEYYTAADGTQIEKNWEPLEARQFSADKGDPVYYLEYTDTGSKPTRFKITWMDVKGNYEKNHGTTEYAGIRGWATFNLGIIGPNPRDGFDGQELEKDFDVALNETHLLNNYTQFNFAPKSSSDKRYVVIDMHPECESFSLLDFAPTPTATVTPGEVQKISLDGKCTEFDGSLLKYDGGNSGRVYFPDVNKVDGKVNISANTDIDDHYGITFDVYMNDRLIGRADEANVDVNLEYIPYGSAVKVAARAEYTGKTYGHKFHSKVVDGTIDCKTTLNAPTLFEENKHLFRNADNEHFDAAIACSFEIAPSFHNNDISTEPLAVYADYQMLDPNGEVQPTCIPWKDHPIKQWYDGVDSKLFEGLYLENFTPWLGSEDTDYSHDTNNWAIKVTDQNINLPVFMSKATKLFDDNTENTKVKFVVKGYAVYPFLVKKSVAAVTVANAPRRAQAVAADFNPADYEIMLVYKNGTADAPVNGNGNSNVEVAIDGTQTTGIADVNADADADAPVEYFNLQGVRIMNPVAGQVVIRRQGTTATKIMVK